MLKFCERYRPYMKSKTRDTSEYGVQYVSGLLRMETKRTMANIGRKTDISPQNMHHFISNSPWSGTALITKVQTEVGEQPEFKEGGMLVIDESADERTGEVSAGVKRQHNGRLGKIELSQVGVFASLVTPQANLWVDGDLFIPEDWFSPTAEEKRRKVGVPEDLVFKTKPQLAWEMIERAQKGGLAFAGVGMDTLYGRNRQLRANLDGEGIEYYGDVPCSSQVYLSPPTLIFGRTKKGERRKTPLILGRTYAVQDLLDVPYLSWHRLTIRANERGHLTADFARLPVWTLYNNTIRQEWLLIRHDTANVTYTLSNAPLETSLQIMAWRKSHRYFIENSNQIAKSDLGWDEFQATKYRAWYHHLALTILAFWFVSSLRLAWAQRVKGQPHLFELYQVEVLPLLSVANIRELLRAALPLPVPSPAEALALVISHLQNRLLSRKSRLNHHPPHT
jgi:SRSO17 transposase